MPARMIVADSEADADMLYATGLFVPDPFVFLEIKGRTYAILSDLELDRARRVSPVDRVVSHAACIRQLQRAGIKRPVLADVIKLVLGEHRMRSVTVPRTFALGLANDLQQRGIRVRPTETAFFPERRRKSRIEVRRIQRALGLAEEGMAAALRVLKRARIGRDGYLYWKRYRLTSEDVRGTINATVAGLGGVAANTIVACGNQGCDPHETGHGPLRARQPIIIDIFPRDARSGYWGDITRTVVRGRASEAVKNLYRAVHQAQETALAMITAGVDGRAVHQAVTKVFTANGYRTGRRRGRMQGFFHGTGHGLGLEIHEAPRISNAPGNLEPGDVVTVEPGLYYPGIGGVRLEDVVVVNRRSYRNLTRFPKFLEL